MQYESLKALIKHGRKKREGREGEREGERGEEEGEGRRMGGERDGGREFILLKYQQVLGMVQSYMQ